jgi:hypothetical protein
MSYPASLKELVKRPPIRGSFPLDHGGILVLVASQ